MVIWPEATPRSTNRTKIVIFDSFGRLMSSSTADNDNLAWVKPMFRAAFDESHAGGKSATGHSPAVAAVKVLTHVIKTSRGERRAIARSLAPS